MRRFGLFAFGAFTGALLSSSLALLLAPTSGPNLRKQMQDYTHQVIDDIKAATQQRRDELETELKTLQAPAKKD
jgi:gas vesicle protein